MLAAHNERLRALDPLLPPAKPLAPATDGDVEMVVDGGVGLYKRRRTDLESFEASWCAADQHQLLARVENVPAMAALLAELEGRLTATPGDGDAEILLTWPSRDTAMTPTFLAHGLVPQTIIVARPADRPSPVPSDEVLVRPIGPADVEAATELWLAEVRWDAQFGGTIERPSSKANIHRELTNALTREPSWTWVAERDDEVTGLIVVAEPERAEWIAPFAAAGPAAYLTCLVVDADHRGAGTGAALVDTAHATLDKAGVALTLLHYAALNPLSVPFWHRCGYRPLWTTWARRPALAAQ